METKQQAIRKMEYKTATAAGAGATGRLQFLEWYRKTLDYRLKILAITARHIFKR